MPEPSEANFPKHEEPSTTTGKGKKEVSPLAWTILGAIATGVLAILNSYFQAQQARDLRYFKSKQSHDLEQEKLRSTLILEAIKSPDAEVRKKSLKFYVEAGFLSDSDKKIENMIVGEFRRSVEHKIGVRWRPVRIQQLMGA